MQRAAQTAVSFFLSPAYLIITYSGYERYFYATAFLCCSRRNRLSRFPDDLGNFFCRFFPGCGRCCYDLRQRFPEQILETLTTDESDRQPPSCCPRPIPPIPRVLPIRAHTPIISSKYRRTVYEPVRINGAEILPDASSILPVSMTPPQFPTLPKSRKFSFRITPFTANILPKSRKQRSKPKPKPEKSS